MTKMHFKLKDFSSIMFCQLLLAVSARDEEVWPFLKLVQYDSEMEESVLQTQLPDAGRRMEFQLLNGHAVTTLFHSFIRHLGDHQID